MLRYCLTVIFVVTFAAGSVAQRGMDLAVRCGKTESAAQHRPVYLRVSQAERVRAQKMQEEG